MSLASLRPAPPIASAPCPHRPASTLARLAARRALGLLAASALVTACGTTVFAEPADQPRGGGASDDSSLGVLTVRNLNVLHGLFCDGACRREERVALLFQWLERGGCPDVVTLQEISGGIAPLIREAAEKSACFSDYEVVHEVVNRFDDAMILSRYPVSESGVTLLERGFRHVLYARIDDPDGPTQVFTTHLASESDGATHACAEGCAAACVAAGASTVRECQAVELADLAAAGGARVVVTGDLNATPGSFEVAQLLAAGFIDSHVAAGNPECDAATGLSCSSGRESELPALERRESQQVERIDYVFVRASGEACGTIDPNTANTNGIGTGPFASMPNPFAPECGAAPLPPCWPSDHDGVELAWSCLEPTVTTASKRATPPPHLAQELGGFDRASWCFYE